MNIYSITEYIINSIIAYRKNAKIYILNITFKITFKIKLKLNLKLPLKCYIYLLYISKHTIFPWCIAYINYALRHL